MVGTLNRDYPPFAPSVAWYADALAALRGGAKLPGAPLRHPNRALIAGANGTEMLSVPVVGSSSALKRTDELYVSAHGEWPRRHLAALEAAYGRAPFWCHYAPAFARILLNPPATLRELNTTLHEMALKALLGCILPSELPHILPPGDVPLWPRHRPLPAGTDHRSLTVFDLLFCRGPEAILTLAPAL